MAKVGIDFVTTGDQVVIGTLRQIGASLVDFAAQGISSAASAFADLAGQMVKGNAEFERYETQFGVLLGSAEAAKDRLAELAEFGAKTPFELPQVVRADKILQAFGLHSEDVAERFGFSGEQIRTIAGDVAAGTGAAFEEIATYLGKFSSGATGEAIARMQELGIVTRQQLAEMGLEFSKSGELLTPVDEAMDVLLKSMQDKFGGMMAAQSGTFEGMMSNFEDFKAAAIRTIGAPIFEAAKGGLGKLLDFLNSPEAQAGLQAVADGLANFVRVAIDWIVNQGVPAFQTLVTWVQANWPQIQATIANVWAQIQPVLQIIADYVVDVVVPALARAVDWIIANWPEIQAAIADVWAQAQPILQAIADFVSDVVIPALAQAVDWVIVNWPHIQATIQAVMRDVQTVIQTVLATIQAFWAEWGDDILAVVNFLTTQLKTIFDAFSAAFAGDWRRFGELLRVAFDNAVNAIIEIGRRIGAWFVSQDWGAIGQGIIDGIGAGIRAAASALANAAVAAARAALEAVRGFLGIKSPSAVFAGIGESMMQGMARGIAASAGMPAFAGAQAAAGVMSATYLGGVTVNVNGAGNPGAVAAAVRAELERIGRTADSRGRAGMGRL